MSFTWTAVICTRRLLSLMLRSGQAAAFSAVVDCGASRPSIKASCRSKACDTWVSGYPCRHGRRAAVDVQVVAVQGLGRWRRARSGLGDGARGGGECQPSQLWAGWRRRRPDPADAGTASELAPIGAGFC